MYKWHNLTDTNQNVKLNGAINEEESNIFYYFVAAVRHRILVHIAHLTIETRERANEWKEGEERIGIGGNRESILLIMCDRLNEFDWSTYSNESESPTDHQMWRGDKSNHNQSNFYKVSTFFLITILLLSESFGISTFVLTTTTTTTTVMCICCTIMHHAGISVKLSDVCAFRMHNLYWKMCLSLLVNPVIDLYRLCGISSHMSCILYVSFWIWFIKTIYFQLCRPSIIQYTPFIISVHWPLLIDQPARRHQFNFICSNWLVAYDREKEKQIYACRSQYWSML